MTNKIDLAIGPVLFDWSREDLLKFYGEAANWPVSTVYIGEVVCPKKSGLTISDLEKTGKQLEAAGKKVYLSSPALVADDMDRQRNRDILSLPFPIEANDPSVIYLGNGNGTGRTFAAGPHITSYNTQTVEFLKSVGVSRLVFPVELSIESMNTITENCAIETEAFVYGNLPLAFSWRCYTSRAFGLLKSNCRHDCRRFPDGMLVEDMDRKPLFKLNGTQVMSAKCSNLIRETDDLKRAGVNTLRISPQHGVTGEVVDIFWRRVNGELDAGEAMDMLAPLEKIGFCNGWSRSRAGLEYVEGEEVGVVVE